MEELHSLSLRFSGTMTEHDAFLLNPLQLAYMGDTVWEMMIRYRLIYQRMNVHHMHQECVRRVNAGAQARALEHIRGELSEREEEIVRRGRNAHVHHPVPKNQDPRDYASATGLESLIGYLYLTGQDERLQTLLEKVLEDQGHG